MIIRQLLLGCTLALILSGCKTTYEVTPTHAKDADYSFVRPEQYVIFGTKSARELLEIVDARKTTLDNGNLKLTLALRNRGHQGFLSWSDKSTDMTLYASAAFYDKTDAHLYTVPKRAIVLPLGETVHVEWQATTPAATDIRVTFSE